MRGGCWWRDADEGADEEAYEEDALRRELGCLVIIVALIELARRAGSGRDLEDVMTAVGESLFWPGAVD